MRASASIAWMWPDDGPGRVREWVHLDEAKAYVTHSENNRTGSTSVYGGGLAAMGSANENANVSKVSASKNDPGGESESESESRRGIE